MTGRLVVTRYYVDGGELVAAKVYERKDGDWQSATLDKRWAARASYGSGRYRRAWLFDSPKDAWSAELERAKDAFTAANESLSKAAERRERAIEALKELTR